MTLSSGPDATLELPQVPLRHLGEIERLVEGRLVDALLARDLTDCAPARGRLLDDLAGAVVADVRVERGRRDQVRLRVPGRHLAIRLDAGDALVGEEGDGVRQ